MGFEALSLAGSSRNLIGYCGLYCGACGIFQGKIKQAVENLQEVIGVYGFDKMMPELAKWEPSLQHYPEFEKVMGGLVTLFGQCPACAGGGGDPTCAVRECCKQKGHTICIQCGEMDDCKTLERYPWARKQLQKIEAVGFDNWVEEMQQRVSAGYCSLDEKV